MKKRLLSLMLAVIMALTMLPGISASAMTPQEGANWAIAQIGKWIDTDGRWGAQCVDLIVEYCRTNFGWNPQGSGNAEAYRTVKLPNSSWQRFQNTPDFIPQPGDIVIWNPAASNGYCGHIGIITSANISTFMSVEQNTIGSSNGSAAVHKSRTYSNVWGFIRPPFSSATVETTQPIHSSTEAKIRNGFFTLKNVASGYFMNVHSGTDANGTPINMWEYDDSTDQQFRVLHHGNGQYKLYAYCSSAGTNRVVDILRGNNPLAAGQKVDLYDPNDDTAQLFYIVPLDDGSYVFEIAGKDGYVIAPENSIAAATNGSQLTLQKYVGASNQKWKFCNNNGGETYPVGAYSPDTYKVNTNGTNLMLRSGPNGSYDIVARVPDTTLLNVTQVNDNWGYTTYNGASGWVCLDYTMYAPSVTSISVSGEDVVKEYTVGEELDTTELVVNVHYSNNTTKTIISGYTTSYDFSTAGTKTVTVTYEGKSTTFTVEVVEPVKETATVSLVAPASVKKGDTVDVTVKLSDSQNMYDGNFIITYDNTVLQLTGNSIGNSLTGQNPTLNTTFAANKIKLSYAGVEAVFNGDMLTLTFEVISDSKTNANVEITEVNMYDILGKGIEVTKVNSPCSIAITKSDFINPTLTFADNTLTLNKNSASSVKVGIAYIGTETFTVGKDDWNEFVAKGQKYPDVNSSAGYVMYNNTFTSKTYGTSGNYAAFIKYTNGTGNTVSEYFTFSIGASGFTISGTVKAFGNGNATVELLCDGEVVDSMTASGTYSFENVEAGSYTIKVSKTKHATREYEITVGSEDVTQNVEIWLYGDVTKDGIINNNDVIQINRKNANLSSVFSQTTDSDYRIKVANVTAPVNADAIINNTDVIQINRMNANLGSVFDRIA